MCTEDFCGGDETNRLFGRPGHRAKDNINPYPANVEKRVSS
jgi:hypothetical protein